MGLDEANDLDVKYSPADILGSSGLQRFGGWVREEWLRDLSGLTGIKVYKEMRDNDAIIGAIMFAFKMLIRQADWYVEPASEEANDKAAAEFLESCMDDMSTSFKDTIQEALSSLIFGWSYHEIVYKKRCGPMQKDGTKRSKFDDGKIGWRRIPMRAQETFFRWVFGDDGSIMAMQQIAPPDYKLRTIPIEKALLFRLEIYKNNPEGRSLLRNAYRPWMFKKNMEEIEGIGVERDLAGLPMATVPPEYLSPNATPDQKAVVSLIKQIVTSIKRDESEGLIFPSETTLDGKQTGFKFSLLSTGSRRQFDTNQIINRYNQQIAMTVLADFIMLGHQGAGSYALSSDKKALFSMALSAIMDSIGDVFNSYAVPRLFQLNDFSGLVDYPKIKHGDIETPDLTELGQYIANLAGSQALTVNDPEMENYLRRAANLPERPEGQPMPAEVAAQQAKDAADAQAKSAQALAQTKQVKPAGGSTDAAGAKLEQESAKEDQNIAANKATSDSGFIKQLKKLFGIDIEKRVESAARIELQRYLRGEFAANRKKFEAWLRRFTGNQDELFEALKDYEMVGMDLAPSIRSLIGSCMLAGGEYAIDRLNGMVSETIEMKFGPTWGAEWLDGKVDHLITGLDAATRDMVYSSIGDMVGEGADWQDIADKLNDDYAFGDARSETIARTESGEAYNAGAIQAWDQSGLVQAVRVSDGDYDETCAATDGMIWSLDFAMDHLLEHPRCEREFELILNDDLPGGEEIDPDQIDQDEEQYSSMTEGSGFDESGNEDNVEKFDEDEHSRGANGRFTDTFRFDNKPSFGSHGTYRTPMPDDSMGRSGKLDMGGNHRVQVEKDAPITKIRAFAEGSGGRGKLKEVEQRDRLSLQHLDMNGKPINPESWRKCRGTVDGTDPFGVKQQYEVHWFQAPNSGKINMKAIGTVDADGKLDRLDKV